MEELFGIPTTQLMWILLAVFGVGLVLLVLSALRNRVSFRMAARNLPRRRAQTGLVILGLMLATMLFSASFTTGDTLTNSLRLQALENLGQVDVEVRAESQDSSGGQPFGETTAERASYFDQGVADDARERLSGEDRVAGVAPLARETVPVTAKGTDLSEPTVSVLGIEEGSMRGFDRLTTGSGETLGVDDLGKNEVYLSADAADGLDVGKGDVVQTTLAPAPEAEPAAGTNAAAAAALASAAPAPRPAELTVAGIYEKGANPSSSSSMVMPLQRLQERVGEEGRINSVLVTHDGPAVEGALGTKDTVDALGPVLRENDLKAEPVKKDAIEDADTNGETFTSVFLLFGQFSVAAGVLLIFLIFVMLAAERKHELGIARAVGMRRGHLMRMFAFEGALYAVIASAIGSLLGVGVGWLMVRVIGEAFAGSGFEIQFATSPQNVVIAFCLGMVLTFAVVLVSSWRVSRLNVVRAIRDIPEPDRKGRSVKGVLLALFTPVAGALLILQGLQAEQMGLYMLGLSLVVVGAALVARILRVPERVAFTAAGILLLALWLAPVSLAPEGMTEGIDLFFISGAMIVLAGVWVVIYNSELLLGAIVALFGWIRGMPPVLRAAVSYPMQSRFRTGMILAMFSLVVFTIVTMSFITAAFSSIFEDTDRLSGGFDIRADAGYAVPIANMNDALKDAEGVDEGDITAVGTQTGLPVDAKQRGTDREPEGFFVQGVDAGYTENVGYDFKTTAKEYDTSEEVWTALREEENTAVISAELAPTRSDTTFAGPPPSLELSGFYGEDATLPDDLFVTVEDSQSGRTRDLRVIGVLEDSAFFASGMLTSKATLDDLAGSPLPAQGYQFRLADGADAGAVVKDLEKAFAENGLQAVSVEREIRDGSASQGLFNNLLMGFMGLGLLVGIAALGVIAARSVVERRQQIGMLRALGFQRGQVRLAFLIESSFVALLGIGLGVALGAALSVGIVDSFAEQFAGVQYTVPWTTLGVIVGLAYAASLLTTFLPARQASKVYPAEALRYAE
ncbi:FtsX-like permease family protein [Rubrobacter tropicus]|uniref:FtsX-like permease family protein n=1 Tax=Rubrobacter tropicus TaxID=2653851 RepID=A0A6G8QBN9_9ACTN|nr:FtsX-like permease family protein [Rubrobacter tropicus]QIN83889.1 FtsX-like permease family protein [Rubrobacter tropicus]